MHTNIRTPSHASLRDECLKAIDRLYTAFERSGTSALCDNYVPTLIEWLGNAVISLGFGFPPLACFFNRDSRSSDCRPTLEVFHPYSGSIGRLPISRQWDACGNNVLDYFGCPDIGPPCGVLDALCQWRNALQLMHCEDTSVGESHGSLEEHQEQLGSIRYSKDFRCVQWHGQTHYFTSTQARIVGMLIEDYLKGTPDLGIETLLEAIDAQSSRLVDLFRGHRAWGTMIVDGATKGSKRIADIPNS